MRTRLIVAAAALIAASALVAVPEPAGSRAQSPARSVDPALARVVTIVLPAGSPATTIPETDLSLGSADRLGPASALIEPGRPAVPEARPEVDQPAAPLGVVVKNYWRWDPNVSFYGPGFYGKRTACGLAYTKAILGVAHRSLPCGTLVTFRNPANGRTMTVPVIDRGPYVAGRQWDLSGGLCLYLKHCYTGPIEWRWGSRSS